MNNCKQCSVETCIFAGVENKYEFQACKKFQLRELDEFEKSLIRHGLIVGTILGFFIGFFLCINLYFWGLIT